MRCQNTDVLSMMFISNIFQGIPMLIILDGDGTLITSSGRAVVTGDKEGKVGTKFHP